MEYISDVHYNDYVACAVWPYMLKFVHSTCDECSAIWMLCIYNIPSKRAWKHAFALRMPLCEYVQRYIVKRSFTTSLTETCCCGLRELWDIKYNELSESIPTK